MSRPTGFSTPGTIVVLRSAASVIVADSSTLTDANIDPTLAVSCFGLESIFVGVEITGGSSPTMTFEPLFRDVEAADGSRWRRRLLGALPGVTLASASAATTGTLSADLSMVELRVFGAEKVFFRCTAVTNDTNTTAWKLLGMPGRYIASPYVQRG
jgi:hypothetical protein